MMIYYNKNNISRIMYVFPSLFWMFQRVLPWLLCWGMNIVPLCWWSKPLQIIYWSFTSVLIFFLLNKKYFSKNSVNAAIFTNWGNKSVLSELENKHFNKNSTQDEGNICYLFTIIINYMLTGPQEQRHYWCRCWYHR